MRKSRPISDLLNALGRLGVDARSRFDNGCLPVDVQARGFKGGHTQLDASKSSQFLTSLMLTGPHTREGLDIKMLGEFKTQYIDITMAVMRAFGAEVEHDNYRRFRIAGGQRYQPRNYAIEPDASNASYFFGDRGYRAGEAQGDRC